MKIFVYSVYDVLAEEFGPLFLAKNDDVAVRMIKMQFKDLRYPQDYVLHCVGVFHNSNGGFDSEIREICNLSDVLLSISDSVFDDNDASSVDKEID